MVQRNHSFLLSSSDRSGRLLSAFSLRCCLRTLNADCLRRMCNNHANPDSGLEESLLSLRIEIFEWSHRMAMITDDERHWPFDLYYQVLYSTSKMRKSAVELRTVTGVHTQLVWQNDDGCHVEYRNIGTGASSLTSKDPRISFTSPSRRPTT